MTNIQLNEPHWKKLGSIELTSENDMGTKIRPWLAQILDPLSIPSGLRTSILTAAKRAADRAARPEDTPAFHLHLSIFIPREEIPAGSTWGFFQINPSNSSKNKTGEENPYEHQINFYIYIESEAL